MLPQVPGRSPAAKGQHHARLGGKAWLERSFPQTLTSLVPKLLREAVVVFNTNFLCLSPWGFLLLQAGTALPFDPQSSFCLSKSPMLLETGLPPSSAWHPTPFCGPHCGQPCHSELLKGSQQCNWLRGCLCPGRESCQVPRTARQHPLAPHRSEPSQEEMLGKHIYYSFNHKPIFALS